MRGYAAARFRRKKSPPSQKTPPRNSVFWTTSKEEELKTLFHRGLSDKELAAHFEEKYGRAMTEKAINVRRLILKLKRVRGRKKKLKTSARIAPVQKCPPRYAHGIQGRMN